MQLIVVEGCGWAFSHCWRSDLWLPIPNFIESTWVTCRCNDLEWCVIHIDIELFLRCCHALQATSWSTELINSKVTPKRESYQEHLPLEVLFFGAGTGVLSLEVMCTILSWKRKRPFHLLPLLWRLFHVFMYVDSARDFKMLALLQGYALRNLAGYAASGLYSSFTIWGQAAGMVSDLAVELQDVQVHWKTGMVGVWIYGFPAEIIHFQRNLDGFWFVTGWIEDL